MGSVKERTDRPELPPLTVGIYDRDGELVRTLEVADPRTAICRAYNDLDVGTIAWPISPARSRRAVKGGAQ